MNKVGASLELWFFFQKVLLKVPTFMRMKFLMVGCDKKSFLISHTTLLWRCVLRACK